MRYLYYFVACLVVNAMLFSTSYASSVARCLDNNVYVCCSYPSSQIGMKQASQAWFSVLDNNNIPTSTGQIASECASNGIFGEVPNNCDAASGLMVGSASSSNYCQGTALS